MPLDLKLLDIVRGELEHALDEARRAEDGHLALRLPATSVDGLLGMLLFEDDPAEYAYRRQQFINFFARSTLDARRKGGEPFSAS